MKTEQPLPKSLQQLTFGYFDSISQPPAQVMGDEPQPNFKAVTAFEYKSAGQVIHDEVLLSNPFRNYNQTPPQPSNLPFLETPILEKIEVKRSFTCVEFGARRCSEDNNTSRYGSPGCLAVTLYALFCPCCCIPRGAVDVFYSAWKCCYEISKPCREIQQNRRNREESLKDNRLANSFFNMDIGSLAKNIKASNLKEPLNSLGLDTD